MTTGIVTMKQKETEGRQFNKVSAQLSIWCTLRRRTSTLSNCSPSCYCCRRCIHSYLCRFSVCVWRFWSNISRPDEKNEMKTRCQQHSRGLVFKQVEAIHDANDDGSNSGYQPHGPGTAGKIKHQICIYWARAIKMDKNKQEIATKRKREQNHK